MSYFQTSVGKTPVICGGFSETIIVTSKCYAFNRHTQSWVVYHDLNEQRFGPSSVILPCDGTMMIAGGANKPDTEILVRNHGWKLGSPLPENKVLGCMLAINECEVAYIGGLAQDSVATTSIFIYNCKTKDWRIAEETLSIVMLLMTRKIFFVSKVISFLDTPRADHACTLLKNPEGDRPTVVIFGGRLFSNSNTPDLGRALTHIC